jgi:hypothetical protein
MVNSGLPSFTGVILMPFPPLEKETELVEIFPLERNSIEFSKKRKN